MPPQTATPRLSPTDVTLLLTAAGAAIGFMIGSVVLGVLQLGAPGGFNWEVDVPFSVMVGGTFGAVVGGIGAPILSWALLRTVPLGRAIACLCASTIAGAGVGHLVAETPAIGGCVGFFVGAVALRILHR